MRSVPRRPGHLNTWSLADGQIWEVWEEWLCWYKSLDTSFGSLKSFAFSVSFLQFKLWALSFCLSPKKPFPLWVASIMVFYHNRTVTKTLGVGYLYIHLSNLVTCVFQNIYIYIYNYTTDKVHFLPTVYSILWWSLTLLFCTLPWDSSPGHYGTWRGQLLINVSTGCWLRFSGNYSHASFSIAYCCG